MAAMWKRHERIWRKLANAMICQSHGSGWICFVSIMCRRATESDVIGKQQPSRHRPRAEPGKHSAGWRQQQGGK